MKKVLIIDHFSQTPDEPGNNRFTYLAQVLLKEAFDVEIVTTDYSHKYKKTRTTPKEMIETLPYKYTMLPEPGYKKNVSLKRFYSHHVFGKNLTKYLETIEKPDLVYAAVPSLDAAYAGAKYCKKNNIPFVVDVQDLWPEAFQLVFNVPVVKEVIFAPLKSTADKIYEAADKLVAVSDTYLKRGMASNDKDKNGLCVFLGTDLTDFDAIREACPKREDDEFRIGYAGTLGHSYNITIIIDAVKALVDKGYKNIVFNVFGDGPLMDSFKAYAEEMKINCIFHGRLDYKDMVSKLCSCDIAVNPIAKGAAQSIINKHGDYAAAGLPVVSTQECEEYRNLLTEYNCGINCECENTDDVINAIEKLYKDAELRKEMGKNSRKMAEERFDRRNTNKKIISLIEELCEGGK